MRSHKALRDLPPHEQNTIIHLAAILRIANAFDAEHDGRISRVVIETQSRASSSNNGLRESFRRNPLPLARNEALVIAAEGYLRKSPTAQRIAAERFWLEMVLRHPIIVKPISRSSYMLPEKKRRKSPAPLQTGLHQ